MTLFFFFNLFLKVTESFPTLCFFSLPFFLCLSFLFPIFFFLTEFESRAFTQSCIPNFLFCTFSFWDRVSLSFCVARCWPQTYDDPSSLRWLRLQVYSLVPILSNDKPNFKKKETLILPLASQINKNFEKTFTMYVNGCLIFMLLFVKNITNKIMTSFAVTKEQ